MTRTFVRVMLSLLLAETSWACRSDCVAISTAEHLLFDNLKSRGNDKNGPRSGCAALAALDGIEKKVDLNSKGRKVPIEG
jgi:hypothetical protein